uniref:ShKT domain-containing protein n=1 Tax=Acrobeloides nanus TaxID=290746 RepID=A0A914C529_9BILA
MVRFVFITLVALLFVNAILGSTTCQDDPKLPGPFCQRFADKGYCSSKLYSSLASVNCCATCLAYSKK